ncbi:MAG: cell envelope integrity protein TolA [Candidatus Electrothrix sp. GM3_4]|nr:cell envelope integrity protein TolA [Candidatus Electrothrix sp. GM3_4]
MRRNKRADGIEETVKKIKNGLHINDTWETFLAQRDRLPNWKVPLSIAAFLHLVVFTGAAVLPDAGEKIAPDNVITIDLLSLPPAALAPPVAGQQVAFHPEKQAAAPRQPKAAEPAAPPDVVEVAEIAEQAPALPVVVPRSVSKTVPKNVAPKPESLPEPAPLAQPVSLNPVKRKKKFTGDIRLAEVKVKVREEREKQEKKQAQQKRQQDKVAKQERKLVAQRKQEKAAKQERKQVARQKRQQEAEAKKRQADQKRKKRDIAEATHLARQAEQTAEQARLEAAQARSEYASVAQAVSELNTPLMSGNSGFSSGGYSELSGRESRRYGGSGREQGINSAVLKQYVASLNGRISNHWQLPETVKTKSNLRTVVALTLHRDGSIEDMQIERKSGDSFFDQSVIRALRSSAPFPYFPALIKQSTLEFALNFTPQGLAL